MPLDALLQLRQRLDRLPRKCSERSGQIASFGQLYGVSPTSIYRALKDALKVRPAHRADHGVPRILPKLDLERYCELVAAMKLRTTNKKGRHLSTARAIELLEEYGVETPAGWVKVPKYLLSKTTVDVYLRRWRLDQPHLTREPPAVRFQAECSNDCWQFDMSPSDLKHVEAPLWMESGRGEPTLMLFSVVDDRSGVCYQEYRCVYGEDAESALRFLFNAMAPKLTMPDFPFEGRPKQIYMDSGPVAKSRVFQNVMEHLGIVWQMHMPAGKDGRRVTARATGKVERAFRTVKELLETLYHFNKPQNEAEANLWLQRYLLNYNDQAHRSEDRSRLNDWLTHLPPEGIRAMCSWEQFCRFAREPERRKVGIDARISVNGTVYEVDPNLMGETVLLLWGLFDSELYVDFDGERFGPYSPVSGPIPLGRYRAFKKTQNDEKADRIRQIADQLGLPIAALAGQGVAVIPTSTPVELPKQPFNTDAQEIEYPTVIAAKLAIAADIGIPLAKVSEADRAFIDKVLTETLVRRHVLQRVRDYFKQDGRRQDAN
ncbi:MAG: IS481 family transposase [Pseudomonadota bacterium]